jgi:hypothetical protein
MKLKNKWFYRVLMTGAFVWILLSGVYFMLLYWLVLGSGLEWLNTRKFYNTRLLRLNVFFTGYLYIILAVRAIPWQWNQHIRETVNIVEHLLFAVLVCTLIFLGSLATNVGVVLYKRILGSCMVFNIIGFINEVYQNLTMSKQPLAFAADSIKDLGINMAGSLLAAIVLTILAKHATDLAPQTSSAT